MTVQTTTQKIASLEIVIDGTSFFYEAHTYNRVAEILAGQLNVLNSGEMTPFGQPKYSSDIDSFKIHYFQFES